MKLSPLSELEKPYTEESVKYKSNSIHNKAGFEMIKNNVVANESLFLISKLHSATKMVEGFIFTDLRHENILISLEEHFGCFLVIKASALRQHFVSLD